MLDARATLSSIRRDGGRRRDVEAARAAFAEGLRLNPGSAQLYHASAQLEGKLLNWGALNELNKRAKLAFPQPGDATVAMQSEVKDEELFQLRPTAVPTPRRARSVLTRAIGDGRSGYQGMRRKSGGEGASRPRCQFIR